MPFFQDTETRDERRGPIWSPFAVIRDNVERLVLVNLGWSIQLLPGVLALAFPELPSWLRIVMGLYSATVIVPATGALYALSFAAARGEHVSLDLARYYFRELAIPSFRTLAPLYGVFGVLIWVGIVSNPSVPSVTTVATLAALVWYLCATYWGPLLISHPQMTAATMVAQSIQIVWRHPAKSLATGLVAAAALVIGLVSIAGLFLIVPVVLTLLHCERYLDVLVREQPTANRE
jgi:uncharacterized membrane protein